MARSTSIQAYNKIKQDGLLSKLRFEVYNYVYHNGPCTAKHIFKELSKVVVARGQPQPNSGVYTTRCSELRDLGVMFEVKKITCPDSNHTVILWDVTPSLPTPVVKKTTRKQLEANLKKLRVFCGEMKQKHEGKARDGGKCFDRVLKEMDRLRLR
jgi:hypothetical protein